MPVNRGPWTVCLGEHLRGRPTRSIQCCGQDRRLRPKDRGKMKSWRRGRKPLFSGEGAPGECLDRGGWKKEFKDSNTASGPISLPFLGSVEIPTPSQPQIKKHPIDTLPWAYPLTSFLPVRILALTSNLFYLFSCTSPSPWATTRNKTEMDPNSLG